MIRFGNRSTLLGLVTMALLLAVGPARADHERGTLHYLAVGVSDYANINNLPCAQKDAIELGKYWDRQKGGLYHEVVGRTLINREATRKNIIDGLERMAVQAKAGDTVVVSLAGHGGAIGPRGGEWGFMPHEFDSANEAATCVFGSDLRDRLACMVRNGATVVLILDSCFSGGICANDAGIILFASSQAHQTSQEHGRIGHGFFTKALLEALEGKADTDNDGYVSLAEIEDYVAKRIAELNKEFPDRLGRPNVQNPISALPMAVRGNLPLVRAGR